jgi:hypothetical protein
VAAAVEGWVPGLQPGARTFDRFPVTARSIRGQIRFLRETDLTPSLFMDLHEMHPRMSWIYPVAGKKKAERGLGSTRGKRVHGNCREHAT